MAVFDLQSVIKDLPPVPAELRNSSGYRDLFVSESLPITVLADLQRLGWSVKDVRLLEGGERVRGLLSGMGMGTINPDKVDLKQLELEAKVYGLLGRDAGEVEKKVDLGLATLDALLDLGSSRFVPEDLTVAEVGPMKRKGGRPKGSKTKVKPAPTPLEQVKEILKQ